MILREVSSTGLEEVGRKSVKITGERVEVKELADEERFELSIELLTLYTLSRRAPSTTRPFVPK